MGIRKLLILTAFVAASSLLPSRAQESERPLFSPLDRPRVASPDGEWLVTVWGAKTDAWLMLEGKDGTPQIQVWPIFASCTILWKPDSTAFAIVDARFSNHQFLLVNFIRGYKSSEQVDLSPVLERRLRASVPPDYDLDKIYVKPLQWLPGGRLLVGSLGVTYKKRNFPGDWPGVSRYFGYIVDPDKRQILRGLSKDEVLKEYHINLEEGWW